MFAYAKACVIDLLSICNTRVTPPQLARPPPTTIERASRHPKWAAGGKMSTSLGRPMSNTIYNSPFRTGECRDEFGS